jgi:hypothetical protein
MTRDGHCRSGRLMGAKGRYLWMGMLVMARDSWRKGEAGAAKGRRGVSLDDRR